MGEHPNPFLMSKLSAAPSFRRRQRRELGDFYFFLGVAEILMLVLGGLAAAWVAFRSAGLPTGSGIVAAAIATLVSFEFLRLTAPIGSSVVMRRRRDVFRDIGVGVAAATAGLSLQHATLDALLCWDAGFALAAGGGLLVLRAGFGAVLRRMLASGSLARNVAVFGSGPIAAKTMARLRESDRRLVAVVGRYSEVRDAGSETDRKRGNARVLLADCRLGIVDAVILATATGNAQDFARVRRMLSGCVQDVYVAVELVDLAGTGARPVALGAIPVLLVSERPLKGVAKYAHSALDKVGAVALLILLAPMLVLIAIAIKLDSPGPVLFRQLRVGYNGQLFWILKFRSMHHHASDRLAKRQTEFEDPRVTRVGRVIRRTSIDEFPQLINVLRGEMSLVGPRPHAPGTSIGGRRVHQLLEEYERRHVVRPGITGLAQVRGYRGGLHTMQQASDRLASDLEYVRRASLWLDINILFLTLFREIRSRRGL